MKTISIGAAAEARVNAKLAKSNARLAERYERPAPDVLIRARYLRSVATGRSKPKTDPR